MDAADINSVLAGLLAKLVQLSLDHVRGDVGRAVAVGVQVDAINQVLELKRAGNQVVVNGRTGSAAIILSILNGSRQTLDVELDVRAVDTDYQIVFVHNSNSFYFVYRFQGHEHHFLSQVPDLVCVVLNRLNIIGSSRIILDSFY